MVDVQWEKTAAIACRPSQNREILNGVKEMIARPERLGWEGEQVFVKAAVGHALVQNCQYEKGSQVREI